MGRGMLIVVVVLFSFSVFAACPYPSSLVEFDQQVATGRFSYQLSPLVVSSFNTVLGVGPGVYDIVIGHRLYSLIVDRDSLRIVPRDESLEIDNLVELDESRFGKLLSSMGGECKASLSMIPSLSKMMVVHPVEKFVNNQVTGNFININIPSTPSITVPSQFRTPDCRETDRGFNVFEAGINRDRSFQYRDECNGDVLTEYYCRGIRSSNVFSYQYTCPRGCFQGECRPSLSPVCDNNQCELGESIRTCPQDCDTVPPTVQWVRTDRTSVIPGSTITILAEVTDNHEVFIVEANIEDSSGTIVETVYLWDLGVTGDGPAGDSIFGGIVTANWPLDTYTVVITPYDFAFNGVISPNRASFEVADLCETVLDNGDPADKIDIVFVGDHFTDLNDFREQAKMHAGLIPGIGGAQDGILNVEPFLSNRDNFNVHLVSDISQTICNPDCDISQSQRLNTGITLSLQLGSACPYDSIITLSRTQFRSSGSFGAPISIVSIDQDPGISETARLTIHEFGHTFGHLNDEYLKYPGRAPSIGGGAVSCIGGNNLLDIDCYEASCLPGDGCLTGCGPLDNDCSFDISHPPCDADGICVANVCSNDPDCDQFSSSTVSDNICTENSNGDIDCPAIATCVQDGVCNIYLCSPDPDCSQYCGLDGICFPERLPYSQCSFPDPDCSLFDATCNSGDGCALGCSPVDSDCGKTPQSTCSAGDGCAGGSCSPVDLDCGPATCNWGDGCLVDCPSIDLDCEIARSCNAGDSCDPNCLSAFGVPDPDCAIMTCNAGDGCRNGCTPEDSDCDPSRVCESGNKCGIGCSPVDQDCGSTSQSSLRAGDGCQSGNNFQWFTVQECLQHAPWQDLMGDGCGSDGVIDCVQGIDSLANLEVSCIEQCQFEYNTFRATQNSIMRYHYGNPYGFGPVNERQICQVIKDTITVQEGLCLNYQLQ